MLEIVAVSLTGLIIKLPEAESQQTLQKHGQILSLNSKYPRTQLAEHLPAVINV